MTDAGQSPQTEGKPTDSRGIAARPPPWRDSPPSAPPKYKHLVKNAYINRAPARVCKSDVDICQCSRCGNCGAGCLNRELLVECTEGMCPVGASCGNQRLQKRHYADMDLKFFGAKGWGIVAKSDIQEGDLIVEYVGEVCGLEEAERRADKYENSGIRNTYVMNLSAQEVIDATEMGNWSRFINHSCNPNCRCEKWTVQGEQRVAIMAMRLIKPGEEITYNYNLDWNGGRRVRCQCGAANCVGFLGATSKLWKKTAKLYPGRQPAAARPTKARSSRSGKRRSKRRTADFAACFLSGVRQTLDVQDVAADAAIEVDDGNPLCTAGPSAPTPAKTGKENGPQVRRSKTAKRKLPSSEPAEDVEEQSNDPAPITTPPKRPRTTTSAVRRVDVVDGSVTEEVGGIRMVGAKTESTSKRREPHFAPSAASPLAPLQRRLDSGQVQELGQLGIFFVSLGCVPGGAARNPFWEDLRSVWRPRGRRKGLPLAKGMGKSGGRSDPRLAVTTRVCAPTPPFSGVCIRTPAERGRDVGDGVEVPISFAHVRPQRPSRARRISQESELDHSLAPTRGLTETNERCAVSGIPRFQEYQGGSVVGPPASLERTEIQTASGGHGLMATLSDRIPEGNFSSGIPMPAPLRRSTVMDPARPLERAGARGLTGNPDRIASTDRCTPYNGVQVIPAVIMGSNLQGGGARAPGVSDQDVAALIEQILAAEKREVSNLNGPCSRNGEARALQDVYDPVPVRLERQQFRERGVVTDQQVAGYLDGSRKRAREEVVGGGDVRRDANDALPPPTVRRTTPIQTVLPNASLRGVQWQSAVPVPGRAFTLPATGSAQVQPYVLKAPVVRVIQANISGPQGQQRMVQPLSNVLPILHAQGITGQVQAQTTGRGSGMTLGPTQTAQESVGTLHAAFVNGAQQRQGAVSLSIGGSQLKIARLAPACLVQGGGVAFICPMATRPPAQVTSRAVSQTQQNMDAGNSRQAPMQPVLIRQASQSGQCAEQNMQTNGEQSSRELPQNHALAVSSVPSGCRVDSSSVWENGARTTVPNSAPYLSLDNAELGYGQKEQAASLSGSAQASDHLKLASVQHGNDIVADAAVRSEDCGNAREDCGQSDSMQEDQIADSGRLVGKCDRLLNKTLFGKSAGDFGIGTAEQTEQHEFNSASVVSEGVNGVWETQKQVSVGIREESVPGRGSALNDDKDDQCDVGINGRDRASKSDRSESFNRVQGELGQGDASDGPLRKCGPEEPNSTGDIVRLVEEVDAELEKGGSKDSGLCESAMGYKEGKGSHASLLDMNGKQGVDSVRCELLVDRSDQIRIVLDVVETTFGVSLGRSDGQMQSEPMTGGIPEKRRKLATHVLDLIWELAREEAEERGKPDIH